MNCWIEINRDAIRHNYRALNALMGGPKIIAVIKANAYGHGSIEIAKVLAAEGVETLAVTRLDEAAPLRAAGISTPILLLTPAAADEVDDVVELNLTACIAAWEDAELLSDAAKKRRMKVLAHLKINTGMGRLGVEPGEAVSIGTRIAKLSGVTLEAAFTHFAFAAESDPSETHHQFAQFQPLIHYLSRSAGIKPQSFHCANSAALLRFPSMRLTTVRPGTLLYGQFPSLLAADAAQTQRLELREGFAVKARIISVRAMEPRQSLGYGGEWRAKKRSRIATIAIGYADGLTQEPDTRTFDAGTALRRSLKQSAARAAQWVGVRRGDAAKFVEVGGKIAPIIGRIAMQQCSIDITDLPEVQLGDVVTLSMRRTSAASHLTRIYVDDERQSSLG